MTDTQEPTLAPSGDVELKPCPFCGGEMMFRKALWPSDGCTDAIIHAQPTDCGMIAFDIGGTDEGVVAAWNQRASPSQPVSADGLAKLIESVFAQYRSDLASAHAEICKLQGLDPAAHSWPEWTPQANTLRWLDEIEPHILTAALHPQSPAPRAGQEFDAGELAGELERLDREATPGPWRVGTWGNGEHVPGLEHIFLDAIEATIQDVLAEDAALIVALRNNLPTIITALRSTQQPDLLRDEELRGKFRCFLSHATGGRTSDINLSLNNISVMASQKVNDAWEAALKKGRSDLLPLLRGAREAIDGLIASNPFLSAVAECGADDLLARIDATLAQEGEGNGLPAPLG